MVMDELAAPARAQFIQTAVNDFSKRCIKCPHGANSRYRDKAVFQHPSSHPSLRQACACHPQKSERTHITAQGKVEACLGPSSVSRREARRRGCERRPGEPTPLKFLSRFAALPGCGKREMNIKGDRKRGLRLVLARMWSFVGVEYWAYHTLDKEKSASSECSQD